MLEQLVHVIGIDKDLKGSCQNCIFLLRKYYILKDQFMDNCDNCGDYVPEVFEYYDLGYLCIRCLHYHYGITNVDLEAEARSRISNNKKFYKRLLQGRLAQVIVENTFRYFGYEVYPYGYESYFTNIIKHLPKKTNDKVLKQIRSSPDMFIFDPVDQEGFIVEVKSTKEIYKINEEFTYFMTCSVLENYIDLWPKAHLVIFEVSNFSLCTVRLKDINLSNLEKGKSKNGEYYKLVVFEHLNLFANQFNIDWNECNEYLNDLRKIVSEFGNKKAKQPQI